MRKIMSSRDVRRRFAARAAIPAAFLSLAAAMAFSGQATAAQPSTCGAREAVLDRLSSRYDEQPVSRGVTATGSLLEILASPAGTWTIIVTIPNGPTCLVSSGEGWSDVPLQVAEDPAV
ncbi:hypothetical protein [Pelagibius marinus]|uniref:hypothetical protein n=1 Tax=Pelagibius marinus TaxID=2762760 RepID=UPI0018728D6B|nr:hypothetical protein [Pelagibius marinus]